MSDINRARIAQASVERWCRCGSTMQPLRTLGSGPHPIAYLCRECGHEEDGKPQPGDRQIVTRPRGIF